MCPDGPDRERALEKADELHAFGDLFGGEGCSAVDHESVIGHGAPPEDEDFNPEEQPSDGEQSEVGEEIEEWGLCDDDEEPETDVEEEPCFEFGEPPGPVPAEADGAPQELAPGEPQPEPLRMSKWLALRLVYGNPSRKELAAAAACV